ncbi:hypothetical protein KM043_005863 [Ampulex compressa]|nr:hypothetical protein KM043_005863 [Ampulex compressa]
MFDGQIQKVGINAVPADRIFPEFAGAAYSPGTRRPQTWRLSGRTRAEYPDEPALVAPGLVGSQWRCWRRPEKRRILGKPNDETIPRSGMNSIVAPGSVDASFPRERPVTL